MSRSGTSSPSTSASSKDCAPRRLGREGSPSPAKRAVVNTGRGAPGVASLSSRHKPHRVWPPTCRAASSSASKSPSPSRSATRISCTTGVLPASGTTPMPRKVATRLRAYPWFSTQWNACRCTSVPDAPASSRSGWGEEPPPITVRDNGVLNPKPTTFAPAPRGTPVPQRTTSPSRVRRTTRMSWAGYRATYSISAWPSPSRSWSEGRTEKCQSSSSFASNPGPGTGCRGCPWFVTSTSPL